VLTVLKLTLSVVMVGVLVAGFTVRPPRESVPVAELKRLVVAVAALYIIGVAALLEHRPDLAGIVVGSGLLLCALAVWLSRGLKPPRDDADGGDDGDPPREPDPGPALLWSFYEEQFRGGSLWADPLPRPEREPDPEHAA
jgi:hypothetical protein